MSVEREKKIKEIFLGHRQELYAFLVRKLKNVETAADLTQETFLRLLGAEALMSIKNPRAYLFRTANNLVTDHYRSAYNKAMISSDFNWNEIYDMNPLQDQVVLSREELDIVKGAIMSLPPRGKEVFILHKFDGLSYAAIARKLGISKNTVIVHMVRSLTHCKARLKGYQQDSQV